MIQCNTGFGVLNFLKPYSLPMNAGICSLVAWKLTCLWGAWCWIKNMRLGTIGIIFGPKFNLFYIYLTLFKKIMLKLLMQSWQIFFIIVWNYPNRERMTVDEALDHPWFSADNLERCGERLSPSRYNQLRRKYKDRSVGYFLDLFLCFPPYTLRLI